MKRALVIVLLVFVVFAAGCQNVYDSPQNVEWDDDVLDPEIFFIAKEVSVIRETADKADPGNYVIVGDAGTATDLYVDLAILNLRGRFVIAIRYNLGYPGGSVYGPYSYSDVVDDCLDGETFVVRLEPNNKPLFIRIGG